jgi:GT2 family glycosyltransferase
LFSTHPAKTAESVRVSVLIVNYRAYEELSSCLESLERFQDGDIEVILVDHAGDKADAEQLTRRFPWIQWIAVPDNPGFAAGVNRAARIAAGRHLLLLNPDCVVHGDAPRTLAAFLDETPAVGAVGPLVRESDGSIQASARRFPNFTTGFAGRTTWLSQRWPGNPWTRRNLLAEGASAPMEVDWVSGACVMVRRQAFEAVGGMDERFFLYWEDADLCLRLKRAGWSTLFHPGAQITHLTGRSSAQARRESLRAFHRSAYLYFVKHGGWFARGVSPIVFLTLQVRLGVKLARLQLQDYRIAGLQKAKGRGTEGLKDGRTQGRRT